MLIDELSLSLFLEDVILSTLLNEFEQLILSIIYHLPDYDGNIGIVEALNNLFLSVRDFPQKHNPLPIQRILEENVSTLSLDF